MTTVAYKDGVLAADTLISCGETVAGFAAKAFKAGTVLCAATGCGGRAGLFLDWVRSGMRGDPPVIATDKDDEAAYGFIYLPDGREVSFWGLIPAQWMRAPFYAHGSGGDVAIGAMAMGASAEEAVRVAMQWDRGTGGEVTVLRHHG